MWCSSAPASQTVSSQPSKQQAISQAGPGPPAGAKPSDLPHPEGVTRRPKSFGHNLIFCFTTTCPCGWPLPGRCPKTIFQIDISRSIQKITKEANSKTPDRAAPGILNRNKVQPNMLGNTPRKYCTRLLLRAHATFETTTSCTQDHCFYICTHASQRSQNSVSGRTVWVPLVFQLGGCLPKGSKA